MRNRRAATTVGVLGVLLLGGGEVECLGLGDQIVEIGGLQRAGLLEDDLALLDDHQRGHCLDAGGLGQILIGVDVHLGECDVRVVRIVGGRLEDRAERAARAAPGGPEVDEHDLVVGDGLYQLSSTAQQLRRACAAGETPAGVAGATGRVWVRFAGRYAAQPLVYGG